MSPTVEEKTQRIYKLQTKDGSVNVHADVICLPSDDNDNTYTLKLGDKVVGCFKKDFVNGWSIDPKPKIR